MANEIDICNLALGHIGQERFIAALTDPSVEAGRCARYWPRVRRSVLTACSFTVSRTRQALTLAVTNPSTQWLYAYNVPANCLVPISINGIEYDPLKPERSGALFSSESGILLCNIPEAVLRFKQDITDVSRYPEDLVVGMSFVLAGYLAGPTLRGITGAKVGASLMADGWNMVRAAEAVDANGSREDNEHIADTLLARS